MNLEPYIWGPHYWNMLHFTAATYDTNPNQSVKLVMKNFIQSLPVFLPCKECQDNAFSFIKTVDLNKVVESRKELFLFFYFFHNRVNNRLKKPLMKLKDALIRYHIPKEEHNLYESLSNNPSGGQISPFERTASIDKDSILIISGSQQLKQNNIAKAFDSKMDSDNFDFLIFIVTIVALLFVVFYPKAFRCGAERPK